MFSENNKNGLVYMTSSVITARHLFTTRYGGVSTGDFASLNLGSNRGDPQENVAENYRRVAAFFGVGRDDCAVTKQVHGNEVRVVTGADKHVCGSKTPYEADGLVTTERGLPIFCFVADCVPALLCDAEHGVIAAVHCGWRSSVADILGVTVEKMCALGAEPESICAAMGASIGRCCFEVGPEVPEAMRRSLGPDAEAAIEPHGEKSHVDLKLLNRSWLEKAGVRAIDICPDYTKCQPNRFWSHRVTGGNRGSQAAIIRLKGGAPA